MKHSQDTQREARTSIREGTDSLTRRRRNTAAIEKPRRKEPKRTHTSSGPPRRPSSEDSSLLGPGPDDTPRAPSQQGSAPERLSTQSAATGSTVPPQLSQQGSRACQRHHETSTHTAHRDASRKRNQPGAKPMTADDSTLTDCRGSRSTRQAPTRRARAGCKADDG
jgi:hypothetical protein